MIDWIHQRCRSWGDQVRHIYLGKDGWPSKTILARMIEEGVVGAGCLRFVQHHPEWMPEEEIKINNAVKRLTEKDREVLMMIYVMRTKGKVIMNYYSLSRTAYYDWVDTVHKRISAALNSISEHNSQNCRPITPVTYARVGTS